ncbi:galactose oxidase [Tundrisphaera sp. TA3]|uniref:galactose oxidase n=1 Tax=Tundrisphaera sp. TA3 TaxID=3435775 RepID=UPI003EBAD965
MRTNLPWLLALILAGPPAEAGSGRWERLPSLPDREGFAGSFAGVSGGALVVAGGANFPGAKPWEGGTKAWTDAVFVLDRPGGEWKMAGKLPRPLGYGVSATWGDGVICVGGSDAGRHHADAFRLVWKDGRIAVEPFPALPQPVANACGAVVGNTLYVAGGQETPDATGALDAAWAIDLDAPSPAWRAIAACPGGGRILAVAAACDGAFWVAGGAGLEAGEGGKAVRRYRTDAHRFDPGRGWTRVADLPRPVVAAPSPAPSDARGFLVAGGDDGSRAGMAQERHTGFDRKAIRFDLAAGRWAGAGDLPAPRVTVPAVRWGRSWVIPGGEVRPGVRSPEVWSWTSDAATETARP